MMFTNSVKEMTYTLLVIYSKQHTKQYYYVDRFDKSSP